MSNFLLYFFGLGMQELLIVLVIMLLLFGGTRLPSLAKGLGESVRNFKKGIAEGDDDTPDKTKAA
jgi:sec-independent protein translocase protein TatA